MTTRREFIKTAAAIAGGAVLSGAGAPAPVRASAAAKSRVVSAAADDMLIESRYNPAAVGRAFAAGMKELTGEKTEAAAWASLFSPDDVVGIKINCLGAPRVSSSVESIQAVAAGLKSAGVKENAIIVWDRMDREFQRTGLTLNKGPVGMRVMGTSTQGESILPWVEGYDRDVFLSLEDGTLKKFRELVRGDFLQTASYRQIFNSVTWLWMLSRMGDQRAIAFEPELRRLYSAYDDREGIKTDRRVGHRQVRGRDHPGRGQVVLLPHRHPGHHQAGQHRRPQAQRGQRRDLGDQEHRPGCHDQQGALPHRLLRQGHPGHSRPCPA